MVFMDVMLPLFLMIGAGFLVGRLRVIDSKSIASTTMLVFLPCLIFSSLTSRGAQSIFLIIIFVIVLTLLMLFFSVLLARFFRLDREQESAFHLSNCFLNAANYGVPFCLFAFGQEGMNIALIFVIGSSISLYTVAIFIASRSRSTVADSAKNIFSMPLIYSVILAMVVNHYGIHIPGIISKSIDMLGAAAIPLNIILLGIQLERTRFLPTREVFSSSAIKLVLAPAVAYVLTLLFGIEGLMRKVLIVESAMPTAINSLIMAIEYDARPEYVGAAVLSSTLLSVVTLSVLLQILG